MAADTQFHQQLIAAASQSDPARCAAACATAIAGRIAHIWPTDGPEISDWLLSVAFELDAPLAELAPAGSSDEGQAHHHSRPHATGHGRKRARTHKGTYLGDDPATPDLNEAYAPIEPAACPAPDFSPAPDAGPAGS